MLSSNITLFSSSTFYHILPYNKRSILLYFKYIIIIDRCRSYNGTHCEPVNAHLTRKYDIHFNFFLTKPTNEVIYNHTLAPSTITFKDAVILADNNQYLKRYYFLKNALDKDEIYDRINLLAQFYGNAVLLRYQYPLMVLTRTKSVFMKRLKRMKKMLVEQGSSDQSKSNQEEKAVSINSSQFLKSVSSSELQRKSVDEGNNFNLDFSLVCNEQYEIHDIYDEVEDNETIGNSLFLSNIHNITKEIACELILERQQNQDDVKHLMLDFDDLDKDKIIGRYQKLIDKENYKQSTKNSSILRKTESIGLGVRNKNKQQQVQPQKLKELMQRKPLTSSITITALEDQIADFAPPPSSPNSYFKKKSMISPLRWTSQEKNQGIMKRSSYYQYQMDHHNFPLANELIIAEDQMEDSPNKNFSRKIKKFPSMDQQDFQNYGVNKAKQRILGSPNGVRPNAEPHTSRQKVKEKQSTERNWGYNSPLMKYSSLLHNQCRDNKIYSGFDKQMDRQTGNLPFRNSPQDYQYQVNQLGRFDTSPPINRYPGPQQPPSLPNRHTSINININNLEQKKDMNRVNVKVNANKNKFELGQEFIEEQKNYRAQKKRKIREKAAALLNRVKSQQYMRTGAEAFNEFEYGDNSGGKGYYERYYE